MKTAIARVGLILPLCAISPAGLATAASLLDSKTTSPSRPAPCSTPAQIAKLGSLGTTTFFAPLDIGPDILARTPHSVVGTAHHRNVAGIAKVVHAFLAPPEQARSIVLGTAARYLLVCPDLAETNRYRKSRPDGLAAQLLANNTPAWLTPVNVPGADNMKVYRIAR